MPKFYIVGGFVRDKIMGLKSKDIDYAVEAVSYQEMRDEIIAMGGEIFLETPEYFTIRAKIPKLGVADYVLCRKDGAYSDGRHPDSVSQGTIYDDLARRDFTMNAIAIDNGSYYDPFDGIGDINRNLIRCVGKAEERIMEDPLRLLRAVRFSITKKMALDGSICHMLSDPNVCRMLSTVSIERIREEMHKCFSCDTFGTLNMLNTFVTLRDELFRDNKLKLKPTLENM